MQQVFAIFAGAFLSGIASLCAGLALFRRLELDLGFAERLSLAFVTGAACLSEIIFVLSTVHLARESVFILLALFAAGLAIFDARRGQAKVRLPSMSRQWTWFPALLSVPFGVVYLVNALAPEMSPDGAAYHLPFVARYLRAHGFERVAGDFYASLSQGIELLFLPAVSLGGHSSAALLHFFFLLDLALLMVCYGRRFGFPIPAATAAFLVFVSPVVGWDGTSAYVDVAAATVMFALLYLLQVWRSCRRPELLIPIGILAGFSYAVKYTGAVAVPFALGFIVWTLWAARKPVLRPVLVVAVAATVFILPWLLKNALITGNPLAPFANRLFPNPYVHVSFEQEYRSYLRHYHLTTWSSAPWELAVKGERLQGFFGPVFLLLPLALLSLRRAAGRRLLLAGAVFALPWFLNIGSRFLIPALPPIALAFALALERPRWLLAGIVIIHALLSWYRPPVRYFDKYAPRIAAFPLRAALRIETADEYLGRKEPGYLIDRMIDRQVPSGDRVFSFEPVPEAWTSRAILTGEYGAANETVADMFRTALVFSACPVRTLEFRFPPTRLTRLRAVLRQGIPGAMWSVSEFRIMKAGKPLVPDRRWRLSGNPNPWDVGLAFDEALVTRWRSWQDAAPGMFLEVDLGAPETIDRVELVNDPESLGKYISLLGMNDGGHWQDLTSSRSLGPAESSGNLRAEAVRQLLARGIRYLLVTPAVFGANDFHENAAAWGIQASGGSEGAQLYRLDPDHTAAEGTAPSIASRAVVLPAGVYDDTDPHIRLREPWTRDQQFQEASGHTLTYSDIPGASASASFRGTAITYVYTRARNRGFAEIYIDGHIKEQLDLYAPDTAWQARRRYEGLGPGDHVIEIRVTGLRNRRSSGCFIDLDGLVIE